MSIFNAINKRLEKLMVEKKKLAFSRSCRSESGISEIHRQEPDVQEKSEKGFIMCFLFRGRRIEKKLDTIISLLVDVRGKEVDMSAELDALTAQVQQTETLEESAITLITGLATQLTAAKEDPAAIQALADSLQAEAAKLSAAITANTPAAPAAAASGPDPA